MSNYKRTASSAQSAQTPPKRARIDYTDIISVVVGDSKTQFTAYKGTLCQQSPFFQAACNQKWTEGQTKTIKLPTIASHVFNEYLHWIYTREFSESEARRSDGTNPETPDGEFVRLTRLWVAGHYLGDFAFCNAVTTACIQLTDRSWVAHESELKLLWGLTLPDTPLRTLILDVIEVTMQGNWASGSFTRVFPNEVIDHFLRLYCEGRLKKRLLPTVQERAKYFLQEGGKTSR